MEEEEVSIKMDSKCFCKEIIQCNSSDRHTYL